jgi:hypothetical protein
MHAGKLPLISYSFHCAKNPTRLSRSLAQRQQHGKVYWTVSDRVVVLAIALDPNSDVAVIVAVLVPAGVPEFAGDRVEPMPPPQLAAITHTASNTIRKPQYILEGKRILLHGSARHKASIDPPATNGHGSVPRVLVAAVVAMVTVVVLVALPLEVTVDGEKLHDD